jgi:hypothetical protein
MLTAGPDISSYMIATAERNSPYITGEDSVVHDTKSVSQFAFCRNYSPHLMNAFR